MGHGVLFKADAADIKYCHLLTNLTASTARIASLLFPTSRYFHSLPICIAFPPFSIPFRLFSASFVSTYRRFLTFPMSAKLGIASIYWCAFPIPLRELHLWQFYVSGEISVRSVRIRTWLQRDYFPKLLSVPIFDCVVYQGISVAYVYLFTWIMTIYLFWVYFSCYYLVTPLNYWRFTLMIRGFIFCLFLETQVCRWWLDSVLLCLCFPLSSTVMFKFFNYCRRCHFL